MLIRVRQGWEIPEREATPEDVFFNRRQLLMAGLAGSLHYVLPIQAIDKTIFPAKRNPQFSLDRPLTPEWAAISFNNFYEFTPEKQAVKNRVSRFQTEPWTIEISGLVNNPLKLDLDDLLKRVPIEERLYRFRCVETWAMAVPWVGFPFAVLVKLVDPKPAARYVKFVSANRPDEMPGVREQPWYPWPYTEGLRFDEAVNPLTFIAVGMYGKPLPKQNGAPVRLVVPWKYGFKSAKSIVKIEFTSKRPRTFWNTVQPNEYGFYSNENPNKPHPRWSQATEKLIPHMEERPTLLYNGYGEFVAHLYKGDEY